MANYDMNDVLGVFSTLAGDAAASNAGDKTVQAEVVKVKNAALGEYQVKFQDAVVSAFATQPNVTYKAGDMVFMLIPEGNLSKKKLIINYASAQSQLTYAEQQEFTNFYVPQGPNWLDENVYGIDHKMAGICSAPRNKRQNVRNDLGANYTDYVFSRWPYFRSWKEYFTKIGANFDADKEKDSIYAGQIKVDENGVEHFQYPWGRCYGQPYHDKTCHRNATDRDPVYFPAPETLVRADRLIESYGCDYEWIGVKAKFRTEFLTDHLQGKYGIRIELLTQNTQFYSDSPEYLTSDPTPSIEKTERYNVFVKELSLDDFVGNPYCYPADTEQVAYFKVKKGLIKGLNRVCLFQNDTSAMTDTDIATSDMTVDFKPTYDDNGELKHEKVFEIWDKNNVFATDIDVRWYEKIDLLNSMFYVHVTAERGTHLRNAKFDASGEMIDPGVPEVILKAHMFYGGKDILNEEDYEVHWYRECPDYTAMSYAGTSADVNGRRETDYCEAGWAPIFRPDYSVEAELPKGSFVEEFGPLKVNQYAQCVVDGAKDLEPGKTIIDADDLTTVYEPAEYYCPSFRELAIPKDRVPWEWYYTCVIVQKPKAQVTDNNGELISKDNDVPAFYRYTPENEDKVHGIKVVRDDSRYSLHLSDIINDTRANGNYSFMRIVDDYDLDRTMDPPLPNIPWFGNWWYKAEQEKLTAYNNNPNNLLGGNIAEPKGFETSSNVNNNGLVDVSLLLENDYVQFLVNAIDPMNVSKLGYGETIVQLGNNRDIVVGVLHKTMRDSDSDTIKIKWEGQTSFLYNYDNTAKSWLDADSFCVTPVLTNIGDTYTRAVAHFYGPEGVEGPEIHKIDYFDGKGLDAGEGYNPNCNTMLRNIYVENLENNLVRIHFGVRNTYDESLAGPAGKNSFWLKLELSNGQTIIDECPIDFSKDGFGANGTGWSVNIWPCVPPKSLAEASAWAYDRSQYLHPLFIDQEMMEVSGTIKYKWTEHKVQGTDTVEYPLYIRPIVFRGGEGTGCRGENYDISVENDDQIHDFFDFPPHLGYWAQTLWDVRFQSGTSSEKLRYNSYLRLYPIGSNAPFSHQDWDSPRNLDYPKPRGFDWADRTGYENYAGVCAITDSDDGHYGAIRVGLNPELNYNSELPPPIDEQYSFEHFNFTVCACTTIYRGCSKLQDDGSYKIDPTAEGRQRVTTIYSYYPVDLIVVNNQEFYVWAASDCGDGMINKKISCNWPKVVEYSATGIQPSYSKDKDGLWFLFGTTQVDRDDGRGSYTMFAPDFTHPGTEFEWWPAYNLSPLVQQISYETVGKATRRETGEVETYHNQPLVKVLDGPDSDINGVPIPEKDREWHWEERFQQYTPNGAINATSPMFGVLATYWRKLEEDPFKGMARFFRNQIFVMSRYSNNGVNCWDGQSISIDTDNNTILAPTIAAGYKNPFCNDFTGVLMGIDQNMRKDGCYNVGLTVNEEGIGSETMQINDGAYDNRQYAYSNEMVHYMRENNPYMAGLYGYQAGIITFGLMENGTAFFGRKDSGAQIVIDGTNGTIYGGGNGYMGSPTVNSPMWNSMRLNLVDLTRNAYKERTVPDSWQMIREGVQKHLTWEQFKRDYGITDAEEQKDQVTHAMTSVNVYGGSPKPGEPYCPKPMEQDNAFRLDFYESFAGLVEKTENGWEKQNRNKLPWWYSRVWDRATVHLTKDLPYFLRYNDDPNKYNIWKDLPDYEEEVWKCILENRSTETIPYREYKVNYWKNALLTYKDTDGDITKKENGENVIDNELSEQYQRSTFGYGRASTTPAIEIGQHIPGLRPGILPWCWAEDILRDFNIPGDRNFMVTYDGTMWSMNAIVIGNIIGSNILGGRIQGAELGIGLQSGTKYAFQYIDTDCDWPPLYAPFYHWDTDPKLNGVRIQDECADDEVIPAFYVDKFGNASAASMRIFGGSIDIGTFHIRGKDPLEQATDNKAYGELIQYGMSDFVGVVHCYGNLGVGPNRNGQSGNSGGSNQGNFTQVKGQVALGIAYSEGGGVEVSVHEWVARNLGMEQTDYGVKRDTVAPYLAAPGAKVGATGTLEQAAFFGIDASPDIPENNSQMWQGHFWPMAWKYDASKTDFIEGGHMPGWFTTMNLFKSDTNFIPIRCDGTADPAVAQGANYFRVGCFGTEFKFGFISKQWLDEDQVVKPDYTTYYGHIGITERNNGVNWAIGIQTWAGTPLIMNSSCQTAVRSIGFIEMVSNCISTEDRTNQDNEPTYVMPSKDPANAWYSNFRLGWYCEEAPHPTPKQNGKFRGHVWNGTVSITAKNGQPDYAQGINNWGHFKDANMDAGIFFSSEGTNAPDKEFWMWTMVDAMHIIQGNKNFADNDANNNEIWMKDDQFGINAKKEFWININKAAHENGQGKPGISIKKDEFILGTDKGDVKMDEDITFEGQYADENHQKNIYARFA